MNQVKQIDVLEYERRAKTVREGLRLLDIIHEGGKKAPDEYYRGLLVFSYQFTSLGSVDDALKILDLIPADYFRKALPGQMSDDQMLCELVQRTAEVLVKEGYAAAPYYEVRSPMQLEFGQS